MTDSHMVGLAERFDEALTPSEATKAAYMGEFNFTVEGFDDEWGDRI